MTDNFTYSQFINEINKIPNTILNITLSDISNTENISISRSELLAMNIDEKPKEQVVEKPKEQVVEKPKEQVVEKPKEQVVEKPKEELNKNGGFKPIQFKSGRKIGTIISPLKLLTRSLKQSGGSSNVSIDKIIKIVYNDSKLIGKIIRYYYTQDKKILNGDELINVSITLLYADLMNKPITTEEEFMKVINPMYVQNIPEMVKSISLDKINRDVDNTLIKTINKNIENIHNLMNSNNQQNGGKEKSTVEEEINLKIRRLSNYLKSKSKSKNTQKGGAVTVEQLKIINDINNDIKTKITELNTSRDTIVDLKKKLLAKLFLEQNTDLLNAELLKYKTIIDNLNDNFNTWYIELINLKIVENVIDDNQYGIAQFILKIKPDIKKDLPDANYKTLQENVNYINNFAPLLKSGKYELIQIPNQVTTPVQLRQPLNYSDKLKEYFNKRYLVLSKLQLETAKNNKNATSIIDTIKEVLYYPEVLCTKDTKINDIVYLNEKLKRDNPPVMPSGKVVVNLTGGDIQLRKPVIKTTITIDPDELIDEFFTSKQYNKFIQKISKYVRLYDKKMDLDDLKKLNKDVDELIRLEEKLHNNFDIFTKYRKIQDELQLDIDNNPVTIAHMKKIVDDNGVLFNKYGGLNTDILHKIKNIENLVLLHEKVEEETKFPNIKHIDYNKGFDYNDILDIPTVKNKEKEILSGISADIDKKEADKKEKEAFDKKKEELTKLLNDSSSFKGGSLIKTYGLINNPEHFTTKTFQKILEEINKD